MLLTFIGHACTVLGFTTSRVLTDPYSTDIGGYTPVDVEADLITISHSNPKWHSCLDDVHGAFHLFEGLNHLGKTTNAKGIKLEALRVFEALHPGHDETEADGGEGPNAMIKITGDGVRVLHMGDVGHRLTETTMDACGEVDVLLAPTGGDPTIALDDLFEFVTKLRPRIVVPIHFAVPNLAMPLLPVEALVEKWPNTVVRHASAMLDVTATLAEAPNGPQLHVLPPLRLDATSNATI